MRAFATLKNFTAPGSREIIKRNLNRILDIVILDMDTEHSTITFLHASKKALDRAKRELYCLGFPIMSLQIENDIKIKGDATSTLV